jgi:hypothetical protein
VIRREDGARIYYSRNRFFVLVIGGDVYRLMIEIGPVSFSIDQ